MTTRFTSENLQAVFTFPFKDEKWQGKLAILTILMLTSFLIIPGIFLAGYVYEIVRRIVVEKQPPSLPDWETGSEYLINGLKMTGVTLILYLPYILLLFAGMLPAFLIPFLGISGNEEMLTFLPMIATPLMMVPMLLATAVGIVTVLVGWVAITHMIAQGEFAAAFRVREWWPIFRHNLAGFLLTYAVMLGLYTVMNFVIQFMMYTVVLCIVLPFISSAIYAYLAVILSALFGQVYVDGAEEAGSEPAAQLSAEIL